MMNKHGRMVQTVQQLEPIRTEKLPRQHVRIYGKSERQQRYERKLMSKQMERMKYLLRKYGDPYYSNLKEDEFIDLQL